MAGTEGMIGRELRRLFDDGAAAGLTEAQLLDRVARRDESAGAAFEAILVRHGPAVLARCRRVLGDSAAAEDVFQATFLVLFRRAGSIRVDGTLAPWLLHVARLAALKAREGELRRRARERRAVRPDVMTPEEEASDVHLLVRAEVDRLPGKYREPVRLCYFEGRTHDDAAAALGWPVGTVRGRLSRAREMLRTRLIRRGVGISPAALVAAMAAGGEARAEVPRALIEATLAATARGAAPGVVTALAAAAARGLATAAGLKAAAAILVVVSLISVGASLLAMASRDDVPKPQPGPTKGEAPARAPVPTVDRYGDPLPKGAIARLGTTRYRHHAAGNLVGGRALLTPDGRTLVTVGADGAARIWGVATGRLVRSIEADDAALSPDGRTLFATGRGAVRALDVPTGRERRRIETSPKENIHRLVASPDGKSLALLAAWQQAVAGRRPETRSALIVHDAETLAQRWRIERDRGFAGDLAFSPDGRRLALAGLDESATHVLDEPRSGSIRLYDVTDGAEVRRIPVEGFEVASVAFSPSGTTMAAGVGDRTIRLYDPATGEERLPRLGREGAVPPPATDKTLHKGYDKACAAACLAFSPDGSRLVSGIEGIGWFNHVDTPLRSRSGTSPARGRSADSVAIPSARSRWRSPRTARRWCHRGTNRRLGSGTWRRAARWTLGRGTPPASTGWSFLRSTGPSSPSATPTGPSSAGIRPMAGCSGIWASIGT